ncbi:conjugal transfer protein [Streptomyces sp. NPDC026673]|uniref:conjugal transfer protein n=1 Tax=Streptomyces sp. NPDC026673 TaxID=3155724 RepID=UPI00340E2AEB
MRTADPAGVAELFADLWLRSDGTNDQSSIAQAVRTLAPNVALPRRSGKASAQVLLRTVAVRSSALTDGSWSVVVAAQYAGLDAAGDQAAGSMVRYFAVPVLSVQEVADAGSFTVTAPPAEVTGPVPAPVAKQKLPRSLPTDGALAGALREFFAAYLTGVGEVDRYLSPGSKLSAVIGTGYRSVGLNQVAADRDVSEEALPGDGTRLQVRADVTATDDAGDQWPLSYFFALTARDGRWEIATIQAGAPTGTQKTSPGRKASAGGASR